MGWGVLPPPPHHLCAMTGWQTLFDQHLSALQPVSLVHSVLIPRPTFILCPPPMCLYVYVHVCVYLLEYGAMLQEHTVRCPTHKSTFIHRTWSWLLSCNTSSSLVCLTHCNMLLPTACCSAIHCYQQLCLLSSIQQHLLQHTASESQVRLGERGLHHTCRELMWIEPRSEHSAVDPVKYLLWVQLPVKTGGIFF